MRALLIAIIACLLFSGCRKDPPAVGNRLDPGVVDFNIHDGVTLKSAMNLLKSLGAEHYELQQFAYRKVMPADSMHYYWLLLKSQPYIRSFDIFKATGESETQLRSIVFLDLDYLKFSVWDSIVRAEHLREMPDSGGGRLRIGSVYIPEGTEDQWLERLRAAPEIESAYRRYNISFGD